MECWAISSKRGRTIFLPISVRAVPHTVSDSIKCSINTCSVKEPHFSSSLCVLVQVTPTDLPWSEMTSEDYQRNSKNETHSDASDSLTHSGFFSDWCEGNRMLFFNELATFFIPCTPGCLCSLLSSCRFSREEIRIKQRHRHSILSVKDVFESQRKS